MTFHLVISGLTLASGAWLSCCWPLSPMAPAAVAGSLLLPPRGLLMEQGPGCSEPLSSACGAQSDPCRMGGARCHDTPT